MAKPKSTVIAAKLRKVIDLCEKGPSLTDDRMRPIEDPSRLWRATWVTPELRAILAWVEGAMTTAQVEGPYRRSDSYTYGK